MKLQVLKALILLSTILLGFQNCGNFAAENMNRSTSDFSSSDTDVRDMEKREDLEKLYYRYSPSKEKYIDVVFDLKNQKAELDLKFKEEIDSIKRSISLTAQDVASIKSAIENLQLNSSVNTNDIKSTAEEYIISYFSDHSSYVAYLETAKDKIDGLSIEKGKDLLSQTINEIIAKKISISLLPKLASLIEKKDALKSLVNRIKNFLKNLKISIDNSGSLNISINAGSHQSEHQYSL